MSDARTILIVDDNASDIDLLQIALEESGVTADVQTAGDGRQAIAVLEQAERGAGAARPDVIVLDLNMPIMNGHELLARLQSDERLRRIPVVVLTTSDAPNDRNRCLGLGAREYLVKPRRFADFAPLVARLRTYLP